MITLYLVSVIVSCKLIYAISCIFSIYLNSLRNLNSSKNRKLFREHLIVKGFLEL